MFSTVMLVFLDLIFCVKYVGSIDSCNNNRIIAGGSDVKLVTKFSILGEFNRINKLLSRDVIDIVMLS